MRETDNPGDRRRDRPQSIDGCLILTWLGVRVIMTQAWPLSAVNPFELCEIKGNCANIPRQSFSETGLLRRGFVSLAIMAGKRYIWRQTYGLYKAALRTGRRI